jgi:hypothetical protein
LFVPIIFSNQEEILIGNGWSSKENGREAVGEAVNKLKENLKLKPDIIILYSTVKYEPDEIIKEINKIFGREVKIFGETSCSGVLTNDGFHKVPLLFSVFPQKKISSGIGISDMEKIKDPKEAGRTAILQAIKDAGKSEKELPTVLLLASSSIGDEEEILEGVEEVLGKGKVPIYGGASADDKIEGRWKIFGKDKVLKRGVVVLAIYSDFKIGHSFLSGFNPTDYKGKITSCKGRVIYELDGRPAGEVYNEWIGGKLKKELESSSPNILLQTNLDPLGKKIYPLGGISSFLLIHPKSFPPDPPKSLEVFVDVKKGDELYLMKGSPEMLVRRPELTARLARARGGIREEDIAGGIFIYCAGTMLAIPEKDLDDMARGINRALGSKPFIGVFTFGELGFFPGIGNLHGNLMSSSIVFSRKK